MSDQLLTVKEIVTKTGYTERTLRRWIADGTLQAYRVGPAESASRPQTWTTSCAPSP